MITYKCKILLFVLVIDVVMRSDTVFGQFESNGKFQKKSSPHTPMPFSKSNMFLIGIFVNAMRNEYEKESQKRLEAERKLQRELEQKNAIYRQQLASRVKGTSFISDFHTIRYES
jgi:hypothetical protein